MTADITIDETDLRLHEATHKDIEFNISACSIFTLLGVGLGVFCSGWLIPEHASASTVCLVLGGGALVGGLVGAGLNLIRSYCKSTTIEYRGLPFEKAVVQIDKGEYKIIENEPSKGRFCVQVYGPVCYCENRVVLKIYTKKDAERPSVVIDDMDNMTDTVERGSSDPILGTKPMPIVSQFQNASSPIPQESPTSMTTTAPFVCLGGKNPGFLSYK